MTIINTNPAVTDSPLIAWDNLVQQGTLVATSSAAGFPVTGLQNGVTSDPWRPNAMPATVTLTLSGARSASVLCFAAHDMATQGVTVILERNVASVWTAVVTYAPTSDNPFMLSFPAVSATEWRVRFTGSNTFRLAVMTLALGLTIPGRIIPPHTPLHRVSEVELVGDSESGTGNFLQADFERVGGKASLAFSVQMNAFATGADFEAFRQHFNRGRPFFIACFPTTYPLDIGYVWRGNGAQSIVPAWQDAVFMSIGMEVSVHVR